MATADGEAGVGGRRRSRRVRRAVAVVALIGGMSVAADGGVASGEATPEAWEPPTGTVYAGPPGDGPHPGDPRLEIGDVVARGTRGADGECVDPPGGVGVGFTPPPGHEMSVSVGLQDGTCDWVVKTIEVRPSDGVEDTRPPCNPEENTPLSGCGVGVRADVTAEAEVEP